MKKKEGKKLKNVLLGFLCGVFVFTLAGIFSSDTAMALGEKGENNYYNGKRYEGMDGIEELRKTLANDGYICVNQNPEMADKLGNETSFWGYYLTVDGSYYQVWVRPEDYYAYLSTGSTEALNQNFVMVDTYVVSEIDDSESVFGPMGNDIPEGTTRCTIWLRAELPDYLQDAEGTVSVKLYEQNSGYYYLLEAQKYSNWETIVTVPTGIYSVFSAVIGDGYWVAAPEEQFETTNYCAYTIPVKVLKIGEDFDESQLHVKVDGSSYDAYAESTTAASTEAEEEETEEQNE